MNEGMYEKSNSSQIHSHPVVVIVHEGPADLRHVGDDFPLGGVEAGQQIVNGRQRGELFQGDRDLDVEFQVTFGGENLRDRL